MTRKHKKPASKRLQAAQDAHNKFLAKHGINGSRRPTLRGLDPDAIQPTGYVRQTPSVSLSDDIPASGEARIIPKARGNHVIGPAYHKGPLMVLGSKAELANNKRRDR